MNSSIFLYLHQRRKPTAATSPPGSGSQSKTGSGSISHVSMISPKGKHSLTPDDMEDFWTAYGNDYLSTKLGLAEMTSHELPVLVDFDLKLEITDLKEWNLNLEDYKVGGNEEVYLEVTRDLPVQELYSLDFVDKLTEIYQQVLQEILSVFLKKIWRVFIYPNHLVFFSVMEKCL